VGRDATSRGRSSALPRRRPRSLRSGQGGTVATGFSPDQAAGVVIEDHGQGPLPLAGADLVDPDPLQVGAGVSSSLVSVHHPGDDAGHAAPADPPPGCRRALGAARPQPGRLVLELAGEPAPCRAQGTAVTTTPCVGPRTLGLSASSQGLLLPRSRARQRRGPSPRSNPGPRRRHTPQRSRSRSPGRTVTTRFPISGSSLTFSTTAPASPRPLAHPRVGRTALGPPSDLRVSPCRDRREPGRCAFSLSPHATHGNVSRPSFTPCSGGAVTPCRPPIRDMTRP